MVTLSTVMMLVFIVAAGITALAMLSVYANVIEHETQLHDLRNRVRDLHYQNVLQAARLSGHLPKEEELGEVEILDEEGEPLDTPLAVEATEEAIEAAEEAIELPEAQAA